MSRLIAELDAALEARAGKGLVRRRRVVDSPQGARVCADGRQILHFGSNDYLGLAGDSRVVAAAQQGAARYGVGAGASHLVSGHFESHEARTLARCCSRPAKWPTSVWSLHWSAGRTPCSVTGSTMPV